MQMKTPEEIVATMNKEQLRHMVRLLSATEQERDTVLKEIPKDTLRIICDVLAAEAHRRGMKAPA